MRKTQVMRVKDSVMFASLEGTLVLLNEGEELTAVPTKKGKHVTLYTSDINYLLTKDEYESLVTDGTLSDMLTVYTSTSEEIKKVCAFVNLSQNLMTVEKGLVSC